MISLFDCGFLHVLFDPNARIPFDKATKLPVVDRAQERIDFLVQTMSQRRDKIIIPTPALAEFLLLASDRRVEYLTLIRRKAVFEIAGFDDPEAIELVEHWIKTDPKKLKANRPETWAKLKYDRQILAIAATRRVECIYSTDKDLHKFAAQLKIASMDLVHLPNPPAVQLSLTEVADGTGPNQDVKQEVQGSGDGEAEGMAAASAAGEYTAQAESTTAGPGKGPATAPADTATEERKESQEE